MGETQYTEKIDIWGVGCVFGEMLKRRPILTGSSDLEQLTKIFQLLGTPTVLNWPNFMQLPAIKEGIISVPFPETHQNTISEKFLRKQYIFFLIM
jgi:serine/threonine protein kinase